MAEEELLVVPRPRVPINGGTTTKIFKYMPPLPEYKGLEIIFPWFNLWSYFDVDYTDSQLVASLNKKHYINLLDLFKQFRRDLVASSQTNLYVSLCFEVSKEGLEVVQTNGYYVGEYGPVYPSFNDCGFDYWSELHWHYRIEPGIKIIR